MMDKASHDRGATRSPWKIVFAAALVSFMVSLDTYVVNISLPSIARWFQVGTGDVSWVVLGYLLALTGTLLIFGRLGDRFGLKGVFQAGFAVFTAASFLCGISNSVWVLVLSRFSQGVGGAMLLSMGPAMIARFLPIERRGAAFGYCATSAALGITLGTPLGGLITGHASWHWIFLINVPIGIAAIAFCQRAIPSDASSAAKGRGETFDAVGAAMIFSSILLLVWSLHTGPERGWLSPLVLGALATGTLLLALFVAWERRTASPLLDLDLFRDRAFTAGNLACCFAAAFLAGNNFVLPFYLEHELRLKPQQTGFVMLIYSLVYMGASLYTGKLSDRISPRTLSVWAMLVGSGAAVWFASTLGFGGLVPVVVYLVVLGLGFAMFVPANNHLVMTMAPEGKLGIVSGLYRMEIYLSMAIGVVLLETVFHRFVGDNVSWSDATAALERGCRNAYGLGAVLCMLSVAFSRLAQSLAPQRRRSQGEQTCLAGEHVG